MSFHNTTKSIVIAASLTLAPWASALAQSSPESIVEGWVSAAEGVDFLTVTHGGISHDGASNTTTISDLNIHLKVDGAKMELKANGNSAKAEGALDYTISFPSISFNSLALENGYYSAQSISADIANLKFLIDGGPNNSSAAKGQYKDFNFTNIKWAQLPEIVDATDKLVSKYYPLVEALTDISFDSGSLGGMSLTQTTGNPAIEMIMSYGATTLGKTVRGNFSDMVIAGMNMQMQAPQDASQAMKDKLSVDFSIGKMTISNYDYRGFVQNFAPGTKAVGDNEPFKSAIGDMTLNNFVMTANGGSFSMDHLSMSDVGVRPPRVDVLNEADILFQQASLNGGEPDEKRLIELVAGIYGAIRLGNFEMAGLKFASPEAGQGKMDLYQINDLSANGLGKFALKGINFVGLEGEYFNLDLFSLANIKFPPLQALLNLEQAQRDNNIIAIMKAIPTLGSYKTNGLEVRVPREGNFSVAESSVDMSGFIGPVPTKVDIRIKDAKMPVKQFDREPREIFTAMGFSDVQFSYGISAIWDEATKVFSINTKANLKDGGALDVDVAVGGIPRSVFENPLTAQPAIALMTVNSANLVFDDQSIVDKGMAFAAAKQGVDPATLKAQAVGMLPFVLQILDKPQFVAELSAAVQKFLETKGKISASATPASPISVMQLIAVGSSAPGAIIDLLNVKVAAE
jgi:hypothetical protein